MTEPMSKAERDEIFEKAEKLADVVYDSGVRTFSTGATRDDDTNKLDYEGFLSPLVLERYAQYLHHHRKQSDGKLRESDNWQKGIPLPQYMKSIWRHLMEMWKIHRGYHTYTFPKTMIQDALCGVIFNAMGYLHELLKEEDRTFRAILSKTEKEMARGNRPPNPPDVSHLGQQRG